MFRSFEANSGTIQRKRGRLKTAVQQGRRAFGARSVLIVREHGKRARTPLAAFFNIPKRPFTIPRSGQPGRKSLRVKVPLPSIARFGRVAYPLLGEVTNRDMRGRTSHGGLGACPRLDESTAAVLGVARSSDPFRGRLKKAASCVLGLLACSRTPCTLRAPKALRPCWTAVFNLSYFR